MARTLPGSKGKDYVLVRVGNTVYAIYSVEIGGGKTIKLAWRIDKDDYKVFGVDLKNVKTMSGASFSSNVHVFGNVKELEPNSDKHPFQQFVDQLAKSNPNASWLKNEQFMRVWLSCWAEGLSYEAILDRLENTHWWQSRTEYERMWEMEMSKADRAQQIRYYSRMVIDALDEMYGPAVDWRAEGYDSAKIKKIAQRIASGKMGDPNQAFQQWLSTATERAEEVQGSAAWIAVQQDLEAQRQYANRPEDMFARLKEEAYEWLGPSGMPSDAKLRKWAENMVSGLWSEADWLGFLKDRARKLYPFLGENQTWQDYVDPYKAMAEKYWGVNIDWADPVLQQLGVLDEKGKATGAMSLKEFELLLRQDDRFYQSEMGHEEGMSLLSLLNEKFRGVV